MNKPHSGRRLHFIRAFPAVLVILLWGCASAQSTQTMSIPQGFTPARHVVFIGLDGWGGAFVEKADMPTAKRMMANGASSLDMRNIMPSISWPNWSTLFCGATPEQRTGGSQRNPPENPIDDFPSIFSLVKSKAPPDRPLPALLHEWSGTGKICTSETADIIRIKSDLASAERAAAYIKEKKPLFTAIVFDQPDLTGHNKRWGSPEYYDKLAEMDSYIAIIERAVEDAGIYDTTVFVLSGDHGGSSKRHGYPFPSHRKIPFIVYGHGIKQNYAIPSPLSILDIAPTMAAILGMEAPPEWTGRPLREVFK